MAFVHGDRVKELTTTSGTGALTLAGATAGFRTFAAGVGVGNECYYAIVHTLDNTWEVGRGTVGPGTFSRDTVYSSTNSNLLVNLAAGDKLVFTTSPATFYTNALDATSHAAIDHTSAPLNLLDATAHSGVDHTAAPLNLLNVTGHEGVDHTLAPLSLLNATGHQAIDHTIAPFNLLNAAGHQAVDHTSAPFNLLNAAGHSAIDHTGITGVGDANPTQVTSLERTAGTEPSLRSFSPLDVATMAGIHGVSGGKLVQTVFATPVTAVITCSTVVPQDATVPQFSEGTFVIGATITPQSISNTLVFEFQASGTITGTPGQFLSMLFQGTGPNAIGVSYGTRASGIANGPQHLWLRHYITAPGSGAPITFNILVGSHTGDPIYINGDNAAAQLFAGTMAATLTISEIAP
ncbi:MAG: hypothetical protein AB7L09_00350 [Nitrospira sp.]